MKNSLKYWNTRALVLSITLMFIGYATVGIKDTRSSIIVSGLALIVCLVVCLMVRPVQNIVEACGNSVIEERINDLRIDYNIPGVKVSDINRALEALEKWKEENAFDWIDNKKKVLRVYFGNADMSKISVIVTDRNPCTLENMSESIREREYSGLFRYYMSDTKVRMCKIDDIQLLCLDLGVVPSIDTINNKNVYIKIVRNKIIDYKVLEN